MKTRVQKIHMTCKCGKEYDVYPSQFKNRQSCSISCGKKGQAPWNKGLDGYRSGSSHHWFGRDVSKEKSPTWKGDEVGYRGLHIWVQNELGTPEQCEHCPATGTGHSMHWANISGNYLREKDDWKRLCPKCHRSFDKGKNYKSIRQMAY